MYSLWGSEIAEKFGDILADGLTTKRSYVVLKRKSRSPIQLQFQPNVYWVNQNALFVGGKLSVFFDKTQAEKIAAIDEIDREDKLANAFEGLDFSVRGPQRVRVMIGVAALAGRAQGEEFIEKFEKNYSVSKILKAIEEKLGIEIEGYRKARAAVAAIYDRQFHQVFLDLKFKSKSGGLDNIPKIDSKALGKMTPLQVDSSLTELGHKAAELAGKLNISLSAPETDHDEEKDDSNTDD